MISHTRSIYLTIAALLLALPAYADTTYASFDAVGDIAYRNFDAEAWQHANGLMDNITELEPFTGTISYDPTLFTPAGVTGSFGIQENAYASTTLNAAVLSMTIDEYAGGSPTPTGSMQFTANDSFITITDGQYMNFYFSAISPSPFTSSGCPDYVSGWTNGGTYCIDLQLDLETASLSGNLLPLQIPTNIVGGYGESNVQFYNSNNTEGLGGYLTDLSDEAGPPPPGPPSTPEPSPFLLMVTGILLGWLALQTKIRQARLSS